MGGLQVDKRLKMPRFHSTHTHYMHTHCTYILWTHTCTHTVHTQTHCAYMHTNIHYVHTYTLCTYKHTLCTHSCVHTFYTHTTPMQRVALPWLQELFLWGCLHSAYKCGSPENERILSLSPTFREQQCSLWGSGSPCACAQEMSWDHPDNLLKAPGSWKLFPALLWVLA